MVVVPKRKSSMKSLTARVLVLGDSRVGKSASIVRYTTGRYIQEYSSSTNGWLYRHTLGFDERRNGLVTIELIEQKDVRFNSATNISTCSLNQYQSDAKSSLAERVAIDQENGEKLEILNRLQWANAFVVIYALNDSSSFNKAIKYLNLIDDNQNKLTGSSKSRLSPPTPQRYQFGSNSTVNQNNSTQPYNNACNAPKRPVLLLANKLDLEASSREVSTNDGKLLAIRHQALFAEISVAQSNRTIDESLANLIDLIELGSFNTVTLTSQQEDQLFQLGQARLQAPNQTDLEMGSRELPTIEFALTQTTQPVWATGVAADFMAHIEDAESSFNNDVFLPNSIMDAEANNKATWIGRPSGSLERPVKRARSNASRYESLKSSFKRASMAIMSSRVLLKEANKSRSGSTSSSGSCKDTSQLQRNDNSDNRGSISSLSSSQLVNQMRYDHNNSWPSEQNIQNTRPTPSENTSSYYADLVSRKLKRSIMKYKSRRKTVAFEEVSPSKSGSVKNTCPSADSGRNSIDRSSSSLSNADTLYYGPLFVSLRNTQRASSCTGSTSSGSISNHSGFTSVNAVRQQQIRQCEPTQPKENSHSQLSSRGSIS